MTASLKNKTVLFTLLGVAVIYSMLYPTYLNSVLDNLINDFLIATALAGFAALGYGQSNYIQTVDWEKITGIHNLFFHAFRPFTLGLFCLLAVGEGEVIIRGEPVDAASVYQAEMTYYHEQIGIHQAMTTIVDIKVIQPFFKINQANDTSYNFFT